MVFFVDPTDSVCVCVIVEQLNSVFYGCTVVYESTCYESMPMKQPIMRIEDRLFDRGWVRSAMATRKCGNIYFRKYFMAVRKFTNIFVLLLILMVGSRDTLFLVCFT